MYKLLLEYTENYFKTCNFLGFRNYCKIKLQTIIQRDRGQIYSPHKKCFSVLNTIIQNSVSLFFKQILVPHHGKSGDMKSPPNYTPGYKIRVLSDNIHHVSIFNT